MDRAWSGAIYGSREITPPPRLVTQFPPIISCLQTKLGSTLDAKYRVQDYKVPVEGGEITVRAVTPGAVDEGQKYPLLFWMHGGGQFPWLFSLVLNRCTNLPFPGLIFGNVDQDDYFMRNLSTDLQVTTLNVDYRFVSESPLLVHIPRVKRLFDSVAPGHPFPTQLNDSFAALKWVSRHPGYPPHDI